MSRDSVAMHGPGKEMKGNVIPELPPETGRRRTGRPSKRSSGARSAAQPVTTRQSSEEEEVPKVSENEKVTEVLERVYKPRRLLEAWRQVKKNAGAAGIDHMSVTEFEARKGELLKLARERASSRNVSLQASPQGADPQAGQAGEVSKAGHPGGDGSRGRPEHARGARGDLRSAVHPEQLRIPAEKESASGHRARTSLGGQGVPVVCCRLTSRASSTRYRTIWSSSSCGVGSPMSGF